MWKATEKITKQEFTVKVIPRNKEKEAREFQKPYVESEFQSLKSLVRIVF